MPGRDMAIEPAVPGREFCPFVEPREPGREPPPDARREWNEIHGAGAAGTCVCRRSLAMCGA